MLLSHPHRCLLPRPRPHNHRSRSAGIAGCHATPWSFRRASGPFCCVGCEAVFDLLAAQRLTGYYADRPAQASPRRDRERRPADRFAGLDDPEVAARLVQFEDGQTAVATFAVPAVHCGSCVWLLEQLWRFDPGITRSEVSLQHRTVRVEFRRAATSARADRRAARRAWLRAGHATRDRPPAPCRARGAGSTPQLGVAGFAFGNMMLFSIPRYANGRSAGDGFQALFDVLNVALALPVLLFSAADYFRIGWRAVRARTISIEVPVAIGSGGAGRAQPRGHRHRRGPGFLDSFAGLVFFLLIGRLFQQKAFERLAFDRTFRSFLPLTVHIERGGAIRTARSARCVRATAWCCGATRSSLPMPCSSTSTRRSTTAS